MASQISGSSYLSVMYRDATVTSNKDPLSTELSGVSGGREELSRHRAPGGRPRGSGLEDSIPTVLHIESSTGYLSNTRATETWLVSWYSLCEDDVCSSTVVNSPVLVRDDP